MSAPDRPRLPVYLIHFDAPEWCASAVGSLLQSQGIDLAVTVIDNGPAGTDLAGHLNRFPEVAVVATGVNLGYTGGANRALRDWLVGSDAPFCVLASHDLHVEPTTLAALVAVAEQRPRCGVLGPVITAPHPAAGGRWTGVRGFQVSPRLDDGPVVERDWVSGACMLVRRELVQQIGFLDERLGSYIEDIDYCLRARDAGWDVCVSTTAFVSGLGSASHRSISYITTNTVLLNAKRDGVRGLARGLAFFGWWAARGLVLSVAPWRSAAQRRETRRYAFARVSGLARLLRGRRLVRIFRRDERQLAVA